MRVTDKGRNVGAANEVPSRGPYAKGLASKEVLVNTARVVFNERGLATTFDDLARELGWTKGRITHHFGTKEDLLLELMERCSTALDANARDHGAIDSIERLASLYEHALDVIDAYRAVYTMSLMANVAATDLHAATQRRQAHRFQQVRVFCAHLVEQGVLVPDVLDQRVFDPIAASTVVLFMGWPSYRASMGRDLSYLHARSVVLRSSIYVLVPHMTDRARAEFEKILPSL